MRARALETVAAIRAIDDPRFTVESLRAHPEALRMLEDGASVGKVYGAISSAAGDETEQTEANLGLGCRAGSGSRPRRSSGSPAWWTETDDTRSTSAQQGGGKT